MSNSEDFLRQAFAGESQANRKYLAFAEAADKEGFAQAAKLFRAAAEAETIHALSHLRVLKGIKTTRENLQAAIAGETYEFTQMYPEMIVAAEAEANKGAQLSFYRANEVEKIRAALYQAMLDSLGETKETYSYYVCPICGYTHEKGMPDTCPVCKTPGKLFREID